jgi:Ca2+-binding RTX toxin-like protein
VTIEGLGGLRSVGFPDPKAPPWPAPEGMEGLALVQTYSRHGGEALVNGTTSGPQQFPAITPLASGGYVVAWADWSVGGTRAQIYDSAGAKVGGEIVVNSFNSFFPDPPAVAGLVGGGFVVAWQNFGDPLDPGSYGVIAQRFDSAGAKVGGEFVLSNTTAGTQIQPDLLALAGGGFVGTWVEGDASGSGIKAQLFDAAGARVGGEIAVNTTTLNNQFAPSLATLAGGGFIVAWYDSAGPASGTAIRVQRFDSTGAAVGTELLVNSSSTNTIDPAVAGLAGGGFVVTWTDAATNDIRAQVYDAAGAKVGGEFLVHTIDSTSEQYSPSVAALPWGGFVITWHDFSYRPDDSDGAVRARIYDSTGNLVGGEFLVNTITSSGQIFPDVAVLASGAFVVAWTDSSGLGGDASAYGVKMQVFDPAAAPADIALSRTTLDEARIEGLAVARITSDSANGQPSYSIVSDSTGGAFAIVGDRLILQDSARLDYETGTSVSVTLRVTDVNGSQYDEVFALTLTDSRLEARYAASGEFLANTTLVGAQTSTAVTSFAGGFVYSWSDDGDIMGQLFTPAGTRIGGEFQVNTTTLNQQLDPALAPLATGGFVAAWADSSGQGGDNSLYGIKAQRFDSAGAKVGGEVLVNVAISGYQMGPSIAGLASGGYVVGWTDEGFTTENGNGVRARVFDAAGLPLSGEIRVNTTTQFDQDESSVAALAGGGFVVTWTDEGQTGGDNDGLAVKGQLFDLLGHKVGGEFLVNTTIAGSQARSSVSGLPGGGFVVAWSNGPGFGGAAGVRAQLFDSAGAKIGSEIVVIASSGGEYPEAQVAALPWGGFAVSWTDRTGTGEDVSGSSVRLQIYDALGGKVGDPVQVNDLAFRDQGPSGLAAAADGSIAIGWNDFGGDGGGPASTGARGRVLSLPGQLAGGAGGELLVAGYGDNVTGGAGRDLLSIDLAGAPNGVTADFRALAGGGTANVGGAAISGIEAAWYLAGTEFGDFLYPYADSAGEGVPATVYGRGGDDTMTLSSFGSVAYGGEGNDSIQGYLGGSGADRIYGGPGSDHLWGWHGNDLLDGGPGADQMEGGLGDDVYVVDHPGDQLTDNSSSGTDEVRTSLAAYTLPAANLITEIENLTGLSGAGQALTGNGLDNRIRGGAGPDTIDGAGGIDTVDYSGEAGGGAILVNLSPVAVAGPPAIGANQGRDSYGGLDTLINIENVITGGGNDRVYGGAGANRIETRAGDDWLDGGAGADVLIGGAGNDVYFVDDLGDTLTENAGEGSDEVRTSLANYSLSGTNLENLTALSDAAHEFRGNASVNILTGGAGNDFLLLHDGGDDSGFGGDGNDVLYFGAALTGADRADGGAGRDSVVLQGNVNLVLGNATLTGIESISLQSGANTRFGDTANNFYDFSVTTANGNVPAGEQLIVNAQSLRAGEDFTFNGSAETDGRFLIYGGHGVDILTGGAGVDVFFFEGQRWGPDDRVNGGGGRDAVVISAGSGLAHIEFGATSLVNIESISLNKQFATDPSQKPSYELVLHNGNVAPGGTLIVNGASLTDPAQIVGIDGSAVQGGNLILLGGAGHDTVTAGGGADTIVGGAGADALTGGAGADTFRYDSATDSVPGLSDLIGDFLSGTDKIDLGRIDANALVTGDQAFTWIGASAFSGAAGELRVRDDGGFRYVEGDTNGDGNADFSIAFYQTAAPQVQADFLL